MKADVVRLFAHRTGQQGTDFHADNIGLEQLRAVDAARFAGSQHGGHHHGALMAEMIVVERMSRDAVSEGRVRR